MTLRTVTCDRLRQQLEDRLPPRVLDIRTAAEFGEFHLPNAIHIPLADLERRSAELDPMVDHVVVSEHGIRSSRACDWLAARGYLRVINLLGGMSEFRFHHG